MPSGKARMYLAHIDAGSFLALCVPITKLRDYDDRIKACVLSQSRGDYLECLGEGTHAVGLHAPERACILG